MSTTTDHYLDIDVHKTDAYVAVMNEDGKLVEEVRVANADLDELAQNTEEAKLHSKREATISPSTTS